MFEKESAQNFSKANPPCKEHGVPAAPAKQNPGCPKPVPSLGWKAHHTPFPRSWGWGRNASSGTLPAGNMCQIVPCSILSPGHLGLDHLGVQRGGGRPLCRAQPWQRCRTRCQDSSEPKPDHLEPPWPKVGAGDAWGFKGLPGPPRAVPRGQAQ